MDSQQIDQLVGQAEARSVAFTDIEVTKNGRHFDGYASVYGEESDLGAFIEMVVPPAIEVGLRNTQNLPMMWDHNMNLPPFATTGAGTLKVTADRRGMRVETDIDERHLLGPTMISMAERGELRGMSIGFVTGRGDNKVSERNGRMLRTITGFKKILDVSPTWDPAYIGTSAEIRSLSTFSSASALVPEQLHDGESQRVVDGPDQEITEANPDTPAGGPKGVCEHGEDCVLPECHPETDGEQEPEEQRSGVDENSFAARRRRLQMMGLTLPTDLRDVA